MTFEKFAAEVTFRVFKPDMAWVTPFFRLTRRITKTSMVVRRLEILNTCLPAEATPVVHSLAKLCAIPRMSTFAISALINQAVSLMSAESCFVNIGVWNGFTFLSGLVGNESKTCIGVDSFVEFGGPRREFLERFEEFKSPHHRFFDADFRRYLSEIHKGGMGVYIYDGPHEYEDQLDGLKLAEPFFSDGCLIFVDDTNWESPRKATLDFVAESRHQYTVVIDVRTPGNGHPTFWNGLMVLRKTM